MPNLTLICGPKASGKTSLLGVFQGILFDKDFSVTPDNYSEILNKSIIDTWKYLFKENQSFISKIDIFEERERQFITKAKELNYNITVYYVGTESVSTIIKRISNEDFIAVNGTKKDIISNYYSQHTAIDFLKQNVNKIVFFTNDNGFKKVAEFKDYLFIYNENEDSPWINAVGENVFKTPKPVPPPPKKKFPFLKVNIKKRKEDNDEY